MKMVVFIIDNKEEGKEIYFYFIKNAYLNYNLKPLSDAINSNESSPLKMCIHEGECDIIFNGELDDSDLKYFDISLFKQYELECCNNIIDRIVYEMAFNEEYCEFISQVIERISKENPELGYKLANNIFPKTVKILENHMDMVTKNFYIYHNKALPTNLDCNTTTTNVQPNTIP